MVKIAVIFNADRLSGRLTKFWTGCYAYHAAFVDEAAGKMYDMHLIRRRRLWPHYNEGEVLLFDAPGVTAEYLERMLDTDTATYGWQDYPQPLPIRNESEGEAYFQRGMSLNR